MELFKNLIYEYKKGMRDLALYTCESDLVEEFIVILEKMKIQYLFINLPKINQICSLEIHFVLKLSGDFQTKNFQNYRHTKILFLE